MRRMFTILALCGATAISHAQAPAPAQSFTDPVALLQAVAKTYAAGADTLRMESIEDCSQNDELRHDWTKTYFTAIKGPGAFYRIEVRSPYGTWL